MESLFGSVSEHLRNSQYGNVNSSSICRLALGGFVEELQDVAHLKYLSKSVTSWNSFPFPVRVLLHRVEGEHRIQPPSFCVHIIIWDHFSIDTGGYLLNLHSDPGANLHLQIP